MIILGNMFIIHMKDIGLYIYHILRVTYKLKTKTGNPMGKWHD